MYVPTRNPEQRVKSVKKSPRLFGRSELRSSCRNDPDTGISDSPDIPGVAVIVARKYEICHESYVCSSNMMTSMGLDMYVS